jgi:hypothetical protein
MTEYRSPQNTDDLSRYIYLVMEYVKPLHSARTTPRALEFLNLLLIMISVYFTPSTASLSV